MQSPLLLWLLWPPVVAWLALASQDWVLLVPVLPGLLLLPIWLLLMAQLVLELALELLEALAVLVLLVPVWLALLVALLAVPLSRVSPRQGRFARLVPAILLYMAYLGLLLLSRDAVAEATLPALPGMWLVHLLFVVLGILLFTGRLPWLGGRRG